MGREGKQWKGKGGEGDGKQWEGKGGEGDGKQWEGKGGVNSHVAVLQKKKIVHTMSL